MSDGLSGMTEAAREWQPAAFPPDWQIGTIIHAAMLKVCWGRGELSEISYAERGTCALAERHVRLVMAGGYAHEIGASHGGRVCS